MKDLLINLILNCPDDFKNSISIKNINFEFLNSIDFQIKCRKFPNYEKFEISRLNGCNVLGKVILHNNIFNVFFDSEWVNMNSIQNNLIKQHVLHELSHVVFTDFKLKYNLDFDENKNLNNQVKFNLVDLIDEYYAERKSLEIINILLRDDEKQYLLNRFENLDNIHNHTIFKSYMNYISTMHAFNQKVNINNILISRFSDKLNEMFENNTYDINLILEDYINIVNPIWNQYYSI